MRSKDLIVMRLVTCPASTGYVVACFTITCGSMYHIIFSTKILGPLVFSRVDNIIINFLPVYVFLRCKKFTLMVFEANGINKEVWVESLPPNTRAWLKKTMYLVCMFVLKDIGNILQPGWNICSISKQPSMIQCTSTLRINTLAPFATIALSGMC